MKLYKDSNQKEEVSSLDLGIVIAGDTKKYDFYVVNDSKAVLENLNFDISHKEVKITSAPKVLKENEVGRLSIEWSPSVTIKEGLKTLLKIQATELWS